MGRVYIVGAGPGDPELITVKGLRLLQAADVVVYDRLVAKELLSYTKRGALLVDVGKSPGGVGPSQEEINELLYKYAKAVDIVVRLHGGDPLVFGRGFEECLYLAERGIYCEFVPGSPAALPPPLSTTYLQWRGALRVLWRLLPAERTQARGGGL